MEPEGSPLDSRGWQPTDLGIETPNPERGASFAAGARLENRWRFENRNAGTKAGSALESAPHHYARIRGLPPAATQRRPFGLHSGA